MIKGGGCGEGQSHPDQHRTRHWRTSGILTSKHGGHDSLEERAAKFRDSKVVGLFHASQNPVV